MLRARYHNNTASKIIRYGDIIGSDYSLLKVVGGL